MKKEVRTPIAITVTRNNRKHKHLDLKLCFRTKHPDRSCDSWDTERIMTIDPSKENAPDIVMNYRNQYNIPFIPGIFRGNNLKYEHQQIINNFTPDLFPGK